MRLDIPLLEVQQFLRNQYQIGIDLKNTEADNLEAAYFVSVVLIINEVKEDVVLLHYKVTGLAWLVTKIAHFFLKKKLDKTPIHWDSKKGELQIDLKKVNELKSFLKFVSISEIHIIGDSIVLEMLARDNT